LLGNTLEFREGDFGKSEAQTLLCIGKFARQEPKEGFDDNDNLCFTGTISGDIIIWKKNKLDRIISPAHSVCNEFSFLFFSNEIRLFISLGDDLFD